MHAYHAAHEDFYRAQIRAVSQVYFALASCRYGEAEGMAQLIFRSRLRNVNLVAQDQEGNLHPACFLCLEHPQLPIMELGRALQHCAVAIKSEALLCPQMAEGTKEHGGKTSSGLYGRYIQEVGGHFESPKMRPWCLTNAPQKYAQTG